jgi:hypothetical protein
MKPTRALDLIMLFGVAAVVSWLLVRSFYSSLPPISGFAGTSLYPVAVIETVIAFLVRSRVGDQKIGDGPGELHPILVARAAALAKASAHVGAAVAGVWAGFGIWILPQHGRIRAAANDSTGIIIGLVAAVLLVAAALWLEHCCKAPGDPPADPRTTRSPGNSGTSGPAESPA